MSQEVPLATVAKKRPRQAKQAVVTEANGIRAGTNGHMCRRVFTIQQSKGIAMCRRRKCHSLILVLRNMMSLVNKKPSIFSNVFKSSD